jgi:hypothetical protein
MAIFHLTAKVISRGKGQSAVAAAAYRSGERLRDEQANEQKFYQARAERIEFTAIMAPKDAPDWAQDRNQLWNHAERAEKRKDAQLSREIEVSLPHELTPQQREWLVKDFAREAFVRKGYAVDIAIHAPDKNSDDRNHHAHIMVTMRTLGEDGFAAKKDPAMNRREQLGEWREQWAHLANRHLERHGHEARIDHRSLKQQGIEREAGIHLGYAANEMAQRGAQSDRMDALRQVIARNDIRVEVGKIERELAHLERVEKAQTRDNAPPSVPEKMDLKSDRQAEPPRQQAENKTAPAPTVAPPKPDAREAFRGKEPPRVTQGAARAVGGVAGGATKIAAKALDGLASAFESLFGGGSAKTSEHRPELTPTPIKEGQAPPAPAPREPEPSPPAPEPVSARTRHAERVAAFVEAERQQRAARRQELLRDYGREVPQENERDAAIERDQSNQRDRGRGGRER